MQDELEAGSPSHKAVLGVCELLGLLFGLPFGEDLYRGAPVSAPHFFFLAIGILFAALGPFWPSTIKRFPQNPVVLAIGRGASDSRNWILVLLVVFVYVTRPASPPTAGEIAKAITSTLPAIHASNPNSTAVQQSLTAAQQAQDALKVAQHTISADASRISVLEGEINSLQQRSLPQPMAKPAPPKKFYSQKQKDQLSDMIEFLTEMIDRQSSAMMQKASVAGISSDIMSRSERMGPPPSPRERAQAIIQSMNDIQATAIKYRGELIRLTQTNHFFPDELAFVGVNQLTEYLNEISEEAGSVIMTMNNDVEPNLTKCADQNIQNLVLNIPGGQMAALGKNVGAFQASAQDVKQKAAILRDSLEHDN